MGLFKKFEPPSDPYQAAQSDGSVPSTVSDKKWGRVRDELPFPVEPTALRDQDDARRRTSFGNQRMRPHLS